MCYQGKLGDAFQTCVPHITTHLYKLGSKRKIREKTVNSQALARSRNASEASQEFLSKFDVSPETGHYK